MMTKPKSCDDCKWCRNFNTMFPNEYTGKACYRQFKNKPAWYVGTIHEMKDLTPCDMFESKNKYDELLNFIVKKMVG